MLTTLKERQLVDEYIPEASRIFRPLPDIPQKQPTPLWQDLPIQTHAIGIDLHTRSLATAVISAIIEVLAWQRPAQQLEKLCTPPASHTLEQIRRSQIGQGMRLRSLRMLSPDPDALEVAIHLRKNARSQAAAARLQYAYSRWRCTSFETILTPSINRNMMQEGNAPIRPRPVFHGNS